MTNSGERVKIFELRRHQSVPGSAIMRFGDWRKREPTVIIENHQWVALGKPEAVVLTVKT